MYNTPIDIAKAISGRPEIYSDFYHIPSESSVGMIQSWEREISQWEIKMSPYIQNVTDNLIGKYRFDQIFLKIKNRDNFLNHLKLSLEGGAVRDMKPETLGKIMCSLDIGDVMAVKRELFEGVTFSGDCEELLRELVALCLSYTIRDRLDPTAMTEIPPYHTVKRVEPTY